MTHVARAVRTTGLFALHHLMVMAGILAFPLVLFSRRVGIPLPMGSIVSRIHAAYDDAMDGRNGDDPDETDQ